MRLNQPWGHGMFSNRIQKSLLGDFIKFFTLVLWERSVQNAVKVGNDHKIRNNTEMHLSYLVNTTRKKIAF